MIVPFDHCDNTCAHCRAGAQSGCVNLGFTESGQAEYTLVTQAEGSLVKTDGMPDPALIPSLLALSDVMPTGWHAAVSAGVRPGGTAVVVGDGAVGLCGVLAASLLGAERVIAMSRHEPRQAIAPGLRRHRHRRRARPGGGRRPIKEITGGVGADAVLECVGTDESMQTAFDDRPARRRRSASSAYRTASSCRSAGCSSKNVGLAGGMAPTPASTCRSCSSGCSPAASTPGWSST